MSVDEQMSEGWYVNATTGRPRYWAGDRWAPAQPEDWSHPSADAAPSATTPTSPGVTPPTRNRVSPRAWWWTGAVAVLVALLLGMFQLGRSVSSAELPPTAPPESFAPLAEGAIDASIKADLETTATALREWFATHPTSTQPVWSASFAPAVHAGNHIDLKLTPGVAGFCLDGWNSAGTATGPWAKQFYYYDSLAGGLQIGGPSAVPPSMASAGSACAGNYGFRPIA